MEKDLKTILKNLKFTDDAKVVQQVTAQTVAVQSRMKHIRHKLVVLSGKGGVGKSMVTVNLALAFARLGLKVGVVDVDLNGPCVPRMLGLKGQTFSMSEEGAHPPVGPLGIKVASMEFFLKSDSPVRWNGSMDLSPVWLGMLEMNVIREFLADIVWGDLDVLLADLPPGAAADKPPAIAGFLPDLDGAVVVTTPSNVTTDVVKKSVVYARDVGIRVLGLIENMSGMLCPQCRTESDLFEGSENVRILSRELDLEVLGRIPLDPRINQACDRGAPLLEEAEPVAARFREIASRIYSNIRKGG